MVEIGNRTTVLLIGLTVCLLVSGSMLAACSSSPTSNPTSPAPSSATQAPSPTPTLEAGTSPLQPTSEIPGQSPLPTPGAGVPPEAPSDIPQPESGKAAISGVLYTFTGEGPIPGTLFYLSPGRGEGKQDPPLVLVGPREEQGDVRGTSDDRGWIALNDIPPGNYFLVVWAPYNWILASESEFDDTPRLITLEPDQQLNLEVIYVSWP